MTRVDFDPDLHPTSLVCQSGSRIATGLELQRRYESAVRRGNPYDMQFLASDAIAKVALLEAELLVRDCEQGRWASERSAAISRPRPVVLADDRSNVVPVDFRRRRTGGAA